MSLAGTRWLLRVAANEVAANPARAKAAVVRAHRNGAYLLLCGVALGLFTGSGAMPWVIDAVMTGLLGIGAGACIVVVRRAIRRFPPGGQIGTP